MKKKRLFDKTILNYSVSLMTLKIFGNLVQRNLQNVYVKEFFSSFLLVGFLFLFFFVINYHLGNSSLLFTFVTDFSDET